MQFKHPEILWALLALLIPILVHLLQLRRFKKTPFTNVAMLQRVVSESRKSQNLKKWLLLVTRLLLLAALIIAFAQPFSSLTDALKKRETIIYLDNSFSMEAQNNGIPLLSKAIQDLVQELPENNEISLFTNENTFKNTTVKRIQNELLSLGTTKDQLALDAIVLKASSLFSKDAATLKNFILVSDLQNRSLTDVPFPENWNSYVVQSLPDKRNNTYIDSLYLGPPSGNQQPLFVRVKGLEEGTSLPISLYNGTTLIAKTAVTGTKQQAATSMLSLNFGEEIKGRVQIDDPVLPFDNQFYFSINERAKPKILAISEAETDFLERVFPITEFEFTNSTPTTLNYSLLDSQNTIILNGLPVIPQNLVRLLIDFSKNGGTIVVIPANERLDEASYNSLLRPIAGLNLNAQLAVKQEIASISFNHPLYRNVFESQVTNFDYPSVNTYYGSNGGNAALNFSNGAPFLVTNEDCYLFTASLATENSNFINSPLIVPTFYNIGENSLKNASLYVTLGDKAEVAIAQNLGQDDILKIAKDQREIIPFQQSYPNKVQLRFDDEPQEDGSYAVLRENDTIQFLSFNYPRTESLLNYGSIQENETISAFSGLPELAEKLAEDTSITNYWKWFVIFALLFAVLELLIQKLLP